MVIDETRSTYSLVIGGESVAAASGETFDAVSPTTNQTVGTISNAGLEDVDRAVTAARRALETRPWPRMTPLERGRVP